MEHMEYSKVELQIPQGYQIKEFHQKMNVFKACEILNTKKQLKYTKSEIIGNEAVLTRHSVCCPHCRKTTPAYPHYLYSDNDNLPESKPNSIKSEETIFQWANIQLSLFDDIDKKMTFQQPEYYDKMYACPNCGYTSLFSNEKFDVIIENDDTCVMIAHKIDSIKDIMNLKWLQKIDLSNTGAFYERIVFDFDLSTTSIQFISDEKVVKSTNISNFDDVMDMIGTLATLIQKNTLIKRILKRFFQTHWSAKIPFNPYELTLNKFILLTDYIDFPHEFYYAIPLSANSNRLDESFKDIDENLHNPVNAMRELQKNSDLNVKSIKRMFSKKPGLFFYLPECKALLDALGDVNLLCKVMNSSVIYQIVLTIHIYPQIVCFYKDYCKVKSKISLCNQLIKNNYVLNKYAVEYCALNEFYKKNEQIKWKNNKNFLKNHISEWTNIISYSTFMPPVPDHFRDCKIDYFYFKWLRTKNEYNTAGKELDNCLKYWNCFDSPVVAVYKGDKIVAAIEVKNNKILQAFRFRNKPIKKSSTLYYAIKKWCEKFMIVFNEKFFE